MDDYKYTVTEFTTYTVLSRKIGEVPVLVGCVTMVFGRNICHKTKRVSGTLQLTSNSGTPSLSSREAKNISVPLTTAAR